jgi:hypothetical protein
MGQHDSPASSWGGLYRVAAVAALVFMVYSLVTMVLVFVVGGQPESAAEAFEMLEKSRLIGLLRLDVLTLLIVPLYYPIFLGIYIALRKDHAAYATLGALLAFAGVTLFLATPSAFSWLALSDKFAAATTAARREQLLGAGEALLVSDMFHGSGAMVGGVLMLIAALVLSVLMLRGEAFGRATAYVGIVSHGLDLLRIFVSIFAPLASVWIMAVAGPLYLVWFPLLARDLFRFARRGASLTGA